MCEAKQLESEAKSASVACQRNTDLRSSEVASTERLAVNEAQGLNENYDSKGSVEQPLATTHAHVFAWPLARNYGGEHTEHHMAACVNHGGLETDEWHETLHDFARLFPIKER